MIFNLNILLILDLIFHFPLKFYLYYYQWLNNSYNIFLILNTFLIHNNVLLYSVFIVVIVTIDYFLEFQNIILFLLI